MKQLSDLDKMVLASLQQREKQYHDLIQKQLADSLNQIYGVMTKVYNQWAVNGKLTKAQMTAYNKYATMEKLLLQKLEPALKNNVKTIKQLLPAMYDASFFNYAWAMDNATGLRLSYGLVNDRSILALFEYMFQYDPCNIPQPYTCLLIPFYRT